ncbi:hypothetical protein AAF712_011548 [Marasmius tenuissimus]|uniref:Glutaminase n=1 Tax=Marasmius tenuissimus TaxID=585030 RepID=A0ABR2ZJ78_9AGAR
MTTSQSFFPSALPIINRSPYLNVWSDATGLKPNNWPTFWTSNHTLSWSGFIRVDGDLYEWLGAAMTNPTLKFTLADGKKKDRATLNDVIITPTRTVYVMTAGAVQLNVTFLSPIEPDDVVLQSFPFSYVFVDVNSSDGAAHQVQVYSDLSGEWLAFANNVPIQWETSTSPVITHSAKTSSQNKLQENSNMAQDATLYHATNPGDGVTWQTGGHYGLRGWFLDHGSLNSTQDTAFRNIEDNFPVFAFSHDLGALTGAKSFVYAIGLARNPVIRQASGSGSFDLPPYWSTKYKSVDKGLQVFLADADNAKARAFKLDERIQTDARKISSPYNDVVSLATRQTLAGVETVVGPSNSIFMFMKDVGGSTRVNPVETLYAAFPTFLYINPTWCQYLLEPLLLYQSSSRYTKSYAAPDLGMSLFNQALSGLPKHVFGPQAPHTPPPLENQTLMLYGLSMASPILVYSCFSTQPQLDTSAMLIMTWAHARFTGQQSLLNTYYSTLQKWAEHLISSNAASPSGGAQSADGLDMNNMTNLAIKGIIGVRSMAEISHTLGKDNDAFKYQDQALSWVKSWKTQALSGGHLTATYGAPNSWALMYNLYADKLLGMKLVSDDIYDAQDTFYADQVLSSNKFGLPFDSNAAGNVKSHWTMLTAATMKDTGTRDFLIKTVRDKAIDNSSISAFPTSYNSLDGKIISGRGSPAQGAVYGLLTLNLESKLVGLSGPSNGGRSNSRKTNTGAIIGGAVGGLAALALVLFGVLLYYRRKQGNRPRYLEQRIARLIGRNGNDSDHSIGDNQIEPFVTPLPTKPKPSPNSNRSPKNTRNDNHPGQNSAGQKLPLTPERSQLAHVRNPRVSPGDSARPTSPSTVTGLHRDMESLRRDMEEMRLRTGYEPPPEYV